MLPDADRTLLSAALNQKSDEVEKRDTNVLSFFVCTSELVLLTAQKICSFAESFNSFLDLFSLPLAVCDFLVNSFKTQRSLEFVSSSRTMFFFLITLASRSEKSERKKAQKKKATNISQRSTQHISTMSLPFRS